MTVTLPSLDRPLERLDGRSDRLAGDEIICVCCVRNEDLRLPYFVDYYRRIGVNRFFFVDNLSDDGTTDFLLRQPDAHVYLAAGSYAASRCGISWINEVLGRHASGHWALTIDADELLVYPSCEDLGLGDLVRYLDRSGAGCLQTFMLDMYGAGPIRQTAYRRGADFLEASGYFDTDSYVEHDRRGLPRRGGPRHRLFWQGRDNPKPSPFLEKFPLVKWDRDAAYDKSTHILANRPPADVTGVLLHFKMFADFREQAEREARRGEHWDGAHQYQTYWSVLEANPDLTAFHAGSMRYGGSRQLERLGFMQRGDWDGTRPP
jgi:hypothetical protein